LRNFHGDGDEAQICRERRFRQKLDGKVVDWMEHVSDEQYKL